MLAPGAKIALLSPCGWGNLGDAAIVDALIAGIRRRVEGVELQAFTLNPIDTERRHGIPAHTCSGMPLAHYIVKEPDGPSLADRPTPRALRLIFPTRAAWRLAMRAASEWEHRRRARAWLDGLDMLVVAGGGQLDDFWGGAFGHPYAMWRWTEAAKRRGARVAVLSVGVGSLKNAITRRLVARTLARADYVSLRDAGSRALLGADSPGAGAPVVPDLAYSLPMARSGHALAARPGRGALRVGVSPLAHFDPRVSPAADRAEYERHVRTTAALVTRLVADGHDVVFFATDGPDEAVIADIRGALGPAAPPAAPTPSVAALIALLSDLDVVVAARLHGVLLSHVAGTPVLALSYERKVAALMTDTGQSEFCLPFVGTPAETILTRLDDLVRRRAALARQIVDTVGGFRARVEAQYDAVFGPAS
jgi:polysaccharide pyruvyl transferase WcaK-like protein